MQETYRVTLVPLETFSFGSDRLFSRKGDMDRLSRYFIRTNYLPEQTTLFGTIRYHLLAQEGLAKSRFNYSDQERQEIRSLIGSRTFSLIDQQGDFGKLHSLSPLFILKDGKERLIRLPFNHDSSHNEDGGLFKPMVLDSQRVRTNQGNLYLPVDEAYDSKSGYAQGFYNLDQGRAVTADQLFTKSIHSGNRIGAEEDGLFKREVYRLDPHYAFAFYVTLDMELRDGFVQMGQKASLFKLSCQKVEPSEPRDFVEDIKRHFAGATPRGLIWHYAFSDCKVEAIAKPLDFSIYDLKEVRQLVTDKAGIRKSKEISLVKAGSVFYGQPHLSMREDLKLAGYNNLIEIKGVKDES